MIQNNENIALESALNWKILEIQSILISQSDDTNSVILQEAKPWILARHIDEVIEERSNSGRCGNPTCSKLIRRFRDGIDQYRIDYKSKQMYLVNESKHFCSVNCHQIIGQYKELLDTSNPLTRPVIKQLDTNRALSSISDIFENVESINILPDKEIPEIPLFEHSSLGEAGNIISRHGSESVISIPTGTKSVERLQHLPQKKGKVETTKVVGPPILKPIVKETSTSDSNAVSRKSVRFSQNNFESIGSKSFEKTPSRSILQILQDSISKSNINHLDTIMNNEESLAWKDWDNDAGNHELILEKKQQEIRPLGEQQSLDINENEKLLYPEWFK